MKCKEREVAMLCQQESLQNFPYYSAVRFNAARTGDDPYTYTIAAGTKVRAFGYGKGTAMDAAGRAGVIATLADTNITNPTETIGEQDVLIRGLSLMLMQNSDARLARAISRDVSVTLELNAGEIQAFMGVPEMWPGGGGFHGAGVDGTAGQGLNGLKNYFPFMSNGLPGADNYGPFPPYFVWHHKGGGPDSQLAISLVAERAITLTSADVTGDNAVANVATGTADFTAPADGELFVDIMVRLHNDVMSPRSHYI